MSSLDNIIKKIKKKKPVIGTVVEFTDSSITELIGKIGYDFVWIDGEHGPFDKKDLLLHIRAAQGAGSAAFVRIPWNDPVLVKPILEMGPSGIIFPFIRTAEEAKKAVSSCIYPPKGIRGFGPIRAIKYGMIDTQAYIEKESSKMWKIIQIEHVEAVNNLDEILKVEGIDAIIVGPMDLSGSIGLLGQTDHNEVKKMFDIITEKALNAGVPVGACIGDDIKSIKAWANRGVNLIGVGVDFRFLLNSAQKAFNNTKNIFKNIKK